MKVTLWLSTLRGELVGAALFKRLTNSSKTSRKSKNHHHRWNNKQNRKSFKKTQFHKTNAKRESSLRSKRIYLRRSRSNQPTIRNINPKKSKVVNASCHFFFCQLTTFYSPFGVRGLGV